jgi:dihydrofolate synthase/folylpolyglutamate synthase
MNFPEALRYLDSFINFEMTALEKLRGNFKFERVARLAESLGSPQAGFPVVHVAGTKGKGSVCAMTAAVLSAGGYRVGLYTSPHLSSCRERVRILESGPRPPGTPGDIFPDQITGEELAGVVAELRPAVERFRENFSGLGRLSFFEVFTLLAFHYFARRDVDIVVCETGVGGRLDATNIVASEVAVITPVGLEHTAVLGRTRTRIAGEKAGIIKPTTRAAVLGAQAPDAREVIISRCRELRVPHVEVDPRDLRGLVYTPGGMSVEVRTTRGIYAGLDSSLVGPRQAENLLTVLKIVEALAGLGFPLDKAAVYRGLNSVVWPARFERLAWRGGVVVCDCAHTDDSCRSLVRTFREVYPGREAVVVFGVSDDKDAAKLARALAPLGGRFVVTSADHPRARRFTDFEARQLFPGKAVEVAAGGGPALEAARRHARAGGIIVVCGSVFLAAGAREHILKEAECTSTRD